jgi:2-keto-4-pentenoate hydratase/2-oxohepta-3-ene-1,7-dioic acid hydratase in catechol pathway
MRIIRFVSEHGIKTGILLDDDSVVEATGSLETGFLPGKKAGRLADLRLASPVKPGKIIAVGRNYAAHAAEHGADVPQEPLLFLKAPSAVIAHRETILLPALSNQVEHEAELAVVIGRRGRHIQPAEAGDFIFGYTCANDVTARDLQRKDGQWTRSKSFDTFCPLGLWIDSSFHPQDQKIACRVNGLGRQESRLEEMIFKIPTLIAAVSAVMTLEPGDVILSGTPAGVGPLVSGDEVEVEIEGLSRLCNPVR